MTSQPINGATPNYLRTPDRVGIQHMRHLLFLLCFSPLWAVAQIPPGYYDSAQGLTGEPLRVALRDIIDGQWTLQYSQLWAAFYRTDRKPDNTVWDIYSDTPSGNPPYSYAFVTDQCGNYNSEGDCFNREHTFPVSWFNDIPPMNVDLHHIYPTDAWVNQQRGSWPFAPVAAPSYTSQNGCKRGPCSWPGCSGTAFEPIDLYKGDLARGYFYMLTRYLSESASWPAPILSGGALLPWVESMLVTWHTQDPVSAKEIARNDSIYRVQNNRNPFIDNPQWVSSIWGPTASVAESAFASAQLWYAEEQLTVRFAVNTPRTPITVMDATGRTVLTDQVSGERATLPFHAEPGVYLAVLGTAQAHTVLRFVR